MKCAVRPASPQIALVYCTSVSLERTATPVARISSSVPRVDPRHVRHGCLRRVLERDRLHALEHRAELLVVVAVAEIRELLAGEVIELANLGRVDQRDRLAACRDQIEPRSLRPAVGRHEPQRDRVLAVAIVEQPGIEVLHGEQALHRGEIRQADARRDRGIGLRRIGIRVTRSGDLLRRWRRRLCHRCLCRGRLLRGGGVRIRRLRSRRRGERCHEHDHGESGHVGSGHRRSATRASSAISSV